MEVLYRGTQKEFRKYDYVCRECLSRIRFMLNEVRVVNDRNETCYVVKCPVCSKETWINENSLKVSQISTDFRDDPFYPK